MTDQQMRKTENAPAFSEHVTALCSRQIQPGEGHAAGRALLAQMYTARTGQPMPTILTTPRGKPYFPGSNVHFSISHTKTRVFCALSDRPVGIDAEDENRDISLALAEKILSPGELAQFRQAQDPRKALLTFWVLKEAQVKCTSEGLRGYPCHTDFSLQDPRVQTIDGCIVAVIKEEA